MNVNPLQDAVYIAMSAFLQTSLGLAQPLVIRGLPNRSAIPPAAPGFVTMQVLRGVRLRTNQSTWDVTDMAPNSLAIEQGAQLRMQLDFYGALAGDWATIMQTLLRDDVGCVALAPSCQPLYTTDPIMLPLEDDEEQYELHFILEAVLQYNPVVTAPMEFANTAEVELINVDVTYPA